MAWPLQPHFIVGLPGCCGPGNPTGQNAFDESPSGEKQLQIASSRFNLQCPRAVGERPEWRPMSRTSGSRFLENLAHLVPGYAGYRVREQRREEDSRFRARILDRLGSIRGILTGANDNFSADPASGCGEMVDRRALRLEGISDAIRYAPYGFSGFFDAPTIREDSLDRILEADLLLFEDLDLIERGCDALSISHRMSARFRERICEIDQRIDQFERHLVMRDKLLGDI
jgi:hypothetical protein